MNLQQLTTEALQYAKDNKELRTILYKADLLGFDSIGTCVAIIITHPDFIDRWELRTQVDKYNNAVEYLTSIEIQALEDFRAMYVNLKPIKGHSIEVMQERLGNWLDVQFTAMLANRWYNIEILQVNTLTEAITVGEYIMDTDNDQYKDIVMVTMPLRGNSPNNDLDIADVLQDNKRNFVDALSNCMDKYGYMTDFNIEAGDLEICVTYHKADPRDRD